MKQKLFSVCVCIILLFACIALFFSGNYIVYLLAYIFSFVFLLFHTAAADSALSEKIVRTLIYACIMAAQIVFDVLVLRTLLECSDTYRFGNLLGILLIFIPFLL